MAREKSFDDRKSREDKGDALVMSDAVSHLMQFLSTDVGAGNSLWRAHVVIALSLLSL